MVFFIFVVVIYSAYRYRLYRYKQVEKELTSRVVKQTQALQEQASAFAYQATHDQLTDLPNRRAFDGWLADNFADFKARNTPLAIAIMDIDHFKRINDGCLVSTQKFVYSLKTKWGSFGSSERYPTFQLLSLVTGTPKTLWIKRRPDSLNNQTKPPMLIKIVTQRMNLKGCFLDLCRN